MNQIEVWLDKTSDPEKPLWCVSLCREDGEEIQCISTHQNEDDAHTAALVYVRQNGRKAWAQEGYNELYEIKEYRT